MTDREVLKDMLRRSGILWQNETNDTIAIHAIDDGPKNDGYPGFVTVFHFTSDGRLDSVGCWE